MHSAKHTHLFTMQDSHGLLLAEFSHYPDDDLLYVKWHGHITANEIVTATKQAGAWRGKLAYSRVLNDKSATTGDWSDALPWLQYEWLPLAVAGGVRAMAYVLSPDVENQYVSQDFIAAIRSQMAVEICESVPAAWAWLHAQHELA